MAGARGEYTVVGEPASGRGADRRPSTDIGATQIFATNNLLTEERPDRVVEDPVDRVIEDQADRVIEERRRTRQEAEVNAAATETAAVNAATHAAAAIAAASRAAEEAETAADAAARAAAELEQAIAAERLAEQHVEATDGRVTRRRAQETAQAAARDATQDPVTEVIAAVDAAAVDAAAVDAAAVGAAAVTVPEDVLEPEPVVKPHRRAGATSPGATSRSASRIAARRSRRRGMPVVLAVVGVVGVVALAAVVATTVGGAPNPAPAAVIQSEVPNGAAAEPAARTPATEAESTAIPHRADVDPTSEKAMAFLSGLRTADIPTSRSGLPETEAAAVICEQLAAGADESALVRALPAVLPTVTKKQSATVVDLAQKYYCR